MRAGETLQSIAQAVWGDANLWYRLAQANGLSGPAGVVEGQRLTLPSGVQRSSFNAATLNPYDPAEAQGDTNPTTPTPQAPSKRNKCGVFGQILLVVIAVAVSIATYGALGGTALTGLNAVAAGAASGAAGSIVSQGVGVATGIQDSFSWEGVALSAIGGGVGAGLDQIGGAVGKVLNANGFVSGAVRGVVGSAITQRDRGGDGAAIEVRLGRGCGRGRGGGVCRARSG